MKTGLDLKSVAIGLVIGLALIVVLGATKNQEPGRFQFVTNSSHAFVFDTQTGEVWEKFESSNGGDTTGGFNEPKTSSATK